MSDLKIAAYKLKDFLENPKVLSKYNGPYGYARPPYTKEWIDFIKMNPCAKEEDLLLILTLDGKAVVGELCLIPGLVSLNGVRKKIFWMRSFFLQDEYKKSGAGGLMLLRAINFSKNLLACGNPREDACKLYRSTGFKELVCLKRFVYFYNAEVIARRYFHNRHVVRFLGLFGGFLMKLYYKIKLPRKTESASRFKKVQRFSKNLDEIINEYRGNCFPKDSNFLNWILKQEKKVYPYEICYESKLVGYFLLRKEHIEGDRHNLPEMDKGVLLDYFLKEDNKGIKNDLVKFAIDFFRNQDVDVFEFQSFDNDFSEICSSCGMLHYRGNRTFLKIEEGAKWSSKAEWFFTHGTGDVILGY